MAYDQVRHVLNNVRSFHKELAETCGSLSEQSSDERLQLLMDIVQQHEERFSTVLSHYEVDTAEGVLNTWLQYAPTEEIQSALQSARLADAHGVAEIAEVVWEFEQALIALYRQLAESTSAQRVQELFSRLVEQEEQKSGRYAWSLEEFQGSEIEGPPAET